MDLYAANILEHFKNPKNKGKIKSPSATAESVNLSCGDEIKIYLKIKNNKISDLKFEGQGCAISQAAASMLSEEIIGMDIAEAEKFSKKDILNLLNVPISERRLKCALIFLLTLKKILRNYRGEKGEIEFSDILKEDR